MNLVVWGAHNSWIVHATDAMGRIVWQSAWMSTRERADSLRRAVAPKLGATP